MTLNSKIRTRRPGEWPLFDSDLPVNPRMHFGSFANGIRYAWMDNANPRNRCHLRLYVQIGSVAEEERERGMAHMLEHLCFNGTAQFPPGQLMHWFQKHGMVFGADTNAYTGFYQTVYMLDLPRTSAALMAEGAAVLRDFATGLRVTDETLASEKRVIDAEEVENRSAELRILKTALDSEFRGSRIARRLPIGIRAVRAKWTPADVANFYNKWYRPENFIIIAAGDFRGGSPLPLLRRTFGNIYKPAAARAAPPVPGGDRRSKFFAWIHDAELATANVSIASVRPWETRVSKKANLHEALALQFARQMFNIRLDELVKHKNCKLLQSSVSDVRESSIMMGTCLEEGEAIAASCDPRDWKEALAACERELRRVRLYGFGDHEFRLVKMQAVLDLDEMVVRESNKTTQEYISEIVAATEAGRIPRSASVNHTLFAPLMASITKEDCHRAYEAAWARGRLAVGGGGNIHLGGSAERAIRNIYEKSARTPVDAPQARNASVFAYASDGSRPGKILKTIRHDEFGVREVAFANGVRAFIKKTNFQKNQIYISTQIGLGRSSIAPRETGIVYVAGETFLPCGLRKHGFDEIRSLLAGRNAQLDWEIEEQSFHFSAATTRRDLKFQFELMHAYLTDPGFREEGFREFRDQMSFDYKQHLMTPDGVLQAQFLKDLYRGDARWSTPAHDDARRVTLAGIKKWLSRALAQGPFDVAVVGDLDINDTIDALRRTFGRVARREKSARAAGGTTRFAKPGFYKYRSDSEIRKAHIKIIFPATDGIDVDAARRIDFLAGVLNERLRVALRDVLGAAYAPEAGAEMSLIYPGDGYIFIEVVCDPRKKDNIIKKCLEAVGDFTMNPPSASEVNKLKKAALTHLRDARRTNEYWISTLAHALRRERGFADLRSELVDLRKLQASEIAAYASQYLRPARAVIGCAESNGQGTNNKEK
ncbi:MAG: insulinase family protein [Planctomycetes bacterium]|nr:insulinase family protein [Planctomycetota bacterium]